MIRSDAIEHLNKGEARPAIIGFHPWLPQLFSISQRQAME
jgi:hypothetical protein